MADCFVNIHTHRPTGRGIELRTAGIHPWNAGTEDVAESVPLLEDAQAIGEIGLDRLRGAGFDRQVEVFNAQLRLAHERGLPVVIHCVKAFEEVMKCLDACQPRAVIFHGFIGSPQQARRALGKGYYLSFGERSFASPKSVGALRETPLSQLFLETDESDTPIEAVYARAAVLREVPAEELRKAAYENYERIFGHG